jgi:hypothetical protein
MIVLWIDRLTVLPDDEQPNVDFDDRGDWC